MDPRDRLLRRFWHERIPEVRMYLLLIILGAAVALVGGAAFLALRYDAPTILIIKTNAALTAFFLLFSAAIGAAACGLATIHLRGYARTGIVLAIVLLFVLVGALLAPRLGERFCARLWNAKDSAACFTYLAVDGRDAQLCSQIDYAPDRERCGLLAMGT